MMRIVVAVLILLAAHFSLSVFMPGDKALFYWPWGNDTRPLIESLGGLPRNNALITTLLASLAGLAFLVAFAALMQIVVPETWFPILTVVASVASIVLFGLHFSALAFLPLLIDAALLFGIFVQHWTVSGLLQP
jgi:hypothetical protein